MMPKTTKASCACLLSSSFGSKERGPKPLKLNERNKLRYKKASMKEELATPSFKNQAGAQLPLCSSAFTPLGKAGLSGLKRPWPAGTWLHATSLDGKADSLVSPFLRALHSQPTDSEGLPSCRKRSLFLTFCVGMSD